MKPWKNFTGLAAWAMRLALLFFIYTSFAHVFLQFNLNAVNFYMAAGFLLAGLLLFIGGFLNHSYTVGAALVLVILSVIYIVQNYSGLNQALTHWFMTGAVSLYFLTNGNK